MGVNASVLVVELRQGKREVELSTDHGWVSAEWMREEENPRRMNGRPMV